MSSGSSLDVIGPPDLSFEAKYAPGLAHTAGVVLLVYDWLITFNWEYERIWQRQRNWFTAFWTLIRYFPIVGKIIANLGNFDLHWTVPVQCKHFASFNPIMLGLVIFLVHFTFVLRIYALYRFSVAALALPIFFLIAELGMSIYPTVNASQSTPMLFGGCIGQVASKSFFIWQIVCTVLFDIVILVLVLGRCWALKRQGIEAPILSVLVRDGIGYFGIIFAANILGIVIIADNVNFMLSQVLFMLSMALPPIIVNRMILDMRAFARAEDLDTFSQSMTAPSALKSILEEFDDRMPTNRAWRRMGHLPQFEDLYPESYALR
ncbi:hypothetical protein AURDEDRAFT_156241 [Auricularia subglabra TFB-10046 SS5]|nr:hypothetical protein AURDEDRAFT_156241 [Auricularia subglabra TFB-10046 SS5]